jgi:hypothetical protein
MKVEFVSHNLTWHNKFEDESKLITPTYVAILNLCISKNLHSHLFLSERYRERRVSYLSAVNFIQIYWTV